MRRERPALFKGRHFEVEIIVLCVRWYLRYPLSLRQLRPGLAVYICGLSRATEDRGVLISMDGCGRALDNVFIERLWRSLKYELIYPGDFDSGADLWPALDRYFCFYNEERPHQSLGYRTPTVSHS